MTGPPVGSVIVSDPARPRAVPPSSSPSGDANPVTVAARPDLPARWPAVVRLELERRHAEMLADVGGARYERVLDLGRADHRSVLRHALDQGLDVGQAGSYDAVVTVAGLARFADLGTALAVVASLLAPDGVVMAVEPGFRPGAMGVLSASLGALLAPARGVHLARDLPATVRLSGLTVTDVERFTMPTLIWPLRSFVQLRAERFATALPKAPR